MKNTYSLLTWQRMALLLGFSFAGLQEADAQLAVFPPTGPDSTHADQLAYQLAGQGVVIHTPQLTGHLNQQNIPAVGFFNGTSSNIGMGQGIVLTTGRLADAAGPNLSSATSTALSGTPVPILNALLPPGQYTTEGVVLEFDVQVSSTGLFFQYVFASEEYLEFSCSNFNDVFGFFISGPGIAGNVPGHPGVQNIALVPGTTTPVSIANVHGFFNATCPVVNEQYYVDNPQGPGTTVQYDGFTTQLTAAVYDLVPGEVYHLKLAIADVGDQAYDSGVFIEAGSLRSCTTPDCDEPMATAPGTPVGTTAGIYPNPAADAAVLMLSGLPAGAAEAQLVLTDLMGRQVATHRVSAGADGTAELKLDTSRLPQGLYLYRLQAGEQQLATGKLQVAR